ncbi:hypothetical protein CC86DRAFT_200547 [Ophiobolus disseminans]|uniref:Uncharacterized protein n=1 Tax=Ophiobolus disseminans TaxID=1469910 RepID=A0A6A7A502_9PLEO|nr:hypothetical protein CC86DRAFT_200547 [Ophiobolus disseminans]
MLAEGAVSRKRRCEWRAGSRNKTLRSAIALLLSTRFSYNTLCAVPIPELSYSIQDKIVSLDSQQPSRDRSFPRSHCPCSEFGRRVL